MRPTAPLLLLASALLVSACNRTSPEMQQEADRAAAATKEAGRKAGDALQQAGQEISQEAKKVEKAAQPTAEDLALTAKIKAKLAADPNVSALKIDVDTQEHVVTLSGRVSTPQERGQAVAIARNTEGVKAVLDRLVAGSEPMLGSAAAATPAPGR
jgi:hyperosmotically inducible protein